MAGGQGKRGSRSRAGYLLVLFTLLWGVLSACTSRTPAPEPGRLRIAILPDQEETHIRAQYEPLVEYLHHQLGMEVELRVPPGYAQLANWFHTRQVDLVLFGGVTYVQAHLGDDAVPLVIRDLDGRNRSVLVVRRESPARAVADLRGSSLAFGDRLSTTGHVMPRFYLELEGIAVDEYFRDVQYSGAHDLTAEWVRDGRIDAGVTNSGVLASMLRDGRLQKGELRIVWESPPLADYVWAVPADMPRELKIRIRNAFLLMNYAPENDALLRRLGANYYLPADHEEFALLERLLRKQAPQGGLP